MQGALAQLVGWSNEPTDSVKIVLHGQQGCTSTNASAKAFWDKFTSYRKAGFVKPFHVRRSPYKCRAYQLAGYIVKEYTGGRQKVEEEIHILRQLRHEGLVSYEFIADEGSRISIVMPYAGVPLRDHRLTRAALYNEDTARHMAHQLASALAFLHSRGIVHRDIKPDNCGVLCDERLLLFDWGEAVVLRDAARLSDRELSRRVGVAGTPLFMPPESLNHLTRRRGGLDREGDFGSSMRAVGRGVRDSGGLRSTLMPGLDIWGLGTVVYFVLAGRDIFVQDSAWELEELADVVNCSSGVALPEGVTVSFAARDFLQRCLERCPARRASANELLQHPWLRGAATGEELQAARAADEAAAMRGAGCSRCGSRCGSVSNFSVGSGGSRWTAAAEAGAVEAAGDRGIQAVGRSGGECDGGDGSPMGAQVVGLVGQEGVFEVGKKGPVECGKLAASNAVSAPRVVVGQKAAVVEGTTVCEVTLC